LPIRNILIEGFSEVETQLYAEYTNTKKSIMFYLIDVFVRGRNTKLFVEYPNLQVCRPSAGANEKAYF
jgi:hypothetical protein